jgi:zinc protease
MALSECVGIGDWRVLFLHRDRLKKVTAADVQAVATRYFKPANRTLGMFLPTQAPDRAEILPCRPGAVLDYQAPPRWPRARTSIRPPIEARVIARPSPAG